MNPHPTRDPALGSPNKKDPTEREKTVIMSSYKDQTTREAKEFKKMKKSVRT